MDEPKEFEVFRKSLDVILENQGVLGQIYEETMNLINNIAKRSKAYMLQISDIEDGLLDDKKDSQKIFSDDLKLLVQDIHQFNQNINTARKEFNTIFVDLIAAFTTAISLVKEEQGVLRELKHAQWYLKYLDVLIRKFRFRIHQLQLMNNILFAFSEEMQTVQKEYKQNLKEVNSEMSSALEQCRIVIKRVDELKS